VPLSLGVFLFQCTRHKLSAQARCLKYLDSTEWTTSDHILAMNSVTMPLTTYRRVFVQRYAVQFIQRVYASWRHSCNCTRLDTDLIRDKVLHRYWCNKMNEFETPVNKVIQVAAAGYHCGDVVCSFIWSDRCERQRLLSALTVGGRRVRSETRETREPLMSA